MANSPLFPDNYAGAEKFALLCEGDRTGYEAAVLRTWRDAELDNNQKFDIVPCGTGAGLFSMADAIGRTVRIVVVEDRDFRTATEVDSDCRRKFADREKRSVAMRAWIAWGRNEIENYFLDEDVLVPAMVQCYKCKEKDVLDARDAAVALLGTYQALQGAVAEIRREWEESDPSVLLVAARPTWSSTGVQPPNVAAVEKSLAEKVAEWTSQFVVAGVAQVPFEGQRLLASFRAKLSAGNSMSIASDEWLNNWSGKEILKLIRQQVSSRFAGPAREPDRQIPAVKWHEFANNASRNALDREIERAIQPVLVQQLWKVVVSSKSAAIRNTLGQIKQSLVL